MFKCSLLLRRFGLWLGGLKKEVFFCLKFEGGWLLYFIIFRQLLFIIFVKYFNMFIFVKYKNKIKFRINNMDDVLLK